MAPMAPITKPVLVSPTVMLLTVLTALLTGLLTACASSRSSQESARRAQARLRDANLPGVSQPGPNAPFLPSEYEGEIFVDYAALREVELFDFIERLPMTQGFFDALASSYHCEIDQLDQTRTALVFEDGGRRGSVRTVSIAEGPDLTPPAELSDTMQFEQIGQHKVLRTESSAKSKPVAIWPQPGLIVVGGHDLLEPILRGDAAPGVPTADLLPLLPGRAVLMQVAVSGYSSVPEPFSDALFALTLAGHQSARGFEAARLRLAAEDGEHLTVSATLRFQQGHATTAEFAQAWRDKTHEWLDDRRYAAAKPFLEQLQIEHDGREVTIAVALGTPREAIRSLERAVIAIMGAMQRDR